MGASVLSGSPARQRVLPASSGTDRRIRISLRNFFLKIALQPEGRGVLWDLGTSTITKISPKDGSLVLVLMVWKDLAGPGTDGGLPAFSRLWS